MANASAYKDETITSKIFNDREPRTFHKCSLINSIFCRSFRTRFSKTKFTNVVLEDVERFVIADSDLEDCRLIGLHVRNFFTALRFKNCIIDKVDSRSCTFDVVHFNNCTLGGRFDYTNWLATTFKNVSAKDCIFIQSMIDLWTVDLSTIKDCELELSTLDRFAITSTTFTDCRIVHTEFGQGVFKNVDFIRCNIRFCNYRGTVFTNVLIDSSMSNISFENCTFFRCAFRSLETVTFKNCSFVDTVVGKSKDVSAAVCRFENTRLPESGFSCS